MRDMPIQFQYRNSAPLTRDMQFHTHSCYEIYYFHSGKCNYLIGDRIYVLQPGDLFLMHGMTLHRPNVALGEEYVRTIIHFEPSYFQNLRISGFAVDVMEPFRQLRNYRLPLRDELKAEAEQLLARIRSFQDGRDAVSSGRFRLAFLDLLFFIYGCCQEPLSEPEALLPTDKERHVQNVISFLEKNFQADVDLDLLEKELHLSKFYLTRIFKEVTGTTIFKYLFQRRINEAKVRFLMDKQVSVSEVCYEVGFKHPAHFSRVFKEQVGCPPEAFRKRMLEEPQ